MTQNSSYVRRPSARRPPEHSPSGKIFLIITEGEKTEPNYFKQLRELLRLRTVEVELVHPEGTDPITLTKYADKCRKERIQKAKKSNIFTPYDEVWVVFDLEKIHDERRKLAQAAMNLPEARGTFFAQSDPCFEYWLLLHWEYTTSPFIDCNNVCQYLKKYLPKYIKGLVPTLDCIKSFPTAIEHSERCRKLHIDCDGSGNPSTEVDKLVRELNNAARKPYPINL
ncbi:RloB family protein [Candidatus Cyanaurora vandensis]|uniref:RloB family protein n=1 Tax=Candidatus Cyanaurora vandensis TaxID=2714958 RepID=UPI0025807E00|nr:RloB family protein [Candidatus Cyanaurora vandensis]